MTSGSEPLAVLQRYWGYESFRPLQEKIVTSLAGGHDACVVMPTGGGKSLCYQLPAAMMSGKTVIVVSPLIALMQDQVAQLEKMGLPAAKLNSSLRSDEQFRIMRGAIEGRYRLLYLSPERLAREDTGPWLKQVPVSFFTIDEAHCISEWGHEFRPDYRQLSSLRVHFPERPIAAFTASATRRVRHDIIDQLRLRDPHKYIASFHRSNLRYLVRECGDEWEQLALLVKALKKHHGSNVIIYSPTIKRVGETVSYLQSVGINAVGYHAKMDNETRKKNQELWMSDEVRVLVGTIAFGLGINKPSVRSVIHLALPKSIEQYYQEAGRAGRDGQPSDCILLWQQKDVGLLTYFIDLINDAAEKDRAWQRYHDICGFARSHRCRHRQICLHFGETPKWNSCSACDVCVSVPDWLSDPFARPKRNRKKSSASVYGNGQLKRPATPQLSQAAIDLDLCDHLRAWRRSIAEMRRIPAFTVMHDTTLEELSRVQPDSMAALQGIHGFGPRKTEQYGHEIIDAIKQFRSRNQKQKSQSTR